jgi:hypothetical protein
MKSQVQNLSFIYNRPRITFFKKTAKDCEVAKAHKRMQEKIAYPGFLVLLRSFHLNSLSLILPGIYDILPCIGNNVHIAPG